ncbi:MAG TPA: ABC transporter ATP-binding protein [Nocardioidaceae bacterium]|nr:ABC transporter ATP-binding protein [Nocardioidaceae bacterium]
MTIVIRTRGLRKVYGGRGGRRAVVDGLDLEVPAAGVHGFLGPNGSGKTTTLRMLLGLARATEGTMEMFGYDVPKRLADVTPHIGAVVEQPRFFPGFTGRRNLELLARAGGIHKTRVVDVLEQVGLTPSADDRFKAYSLGMKQRLAIAATLLKQPALLILDEPTNGLDPQGIRDIRTMIRALGNAGVTVLLSSHLLAEVEQVCDSVTIVNRGRLVHSGTVAEMVSARAGDRVRVRVSDPREAQVVLTSAHFAVRRNGNDLIVEHAGDPSAITRVLAGAHLYVSELAPLDAGLESAFLDLVSPEQEGAIA